MNTLRLTTRRGATALLLLSLSTAGLYPHLLAGEARGADACATERQEICGCGMKDGRCCPMGCCRTPEPAREQAPAPPNRSDQRIQLLDLALMADAKIHDAAAAGFRDAFRDAPALAISHSLIALGVRLNI
jgi:hypothetical protein